MYRNVPDYGQVGYRSGMSSVAQMPTPASGLVGRVAENVRIECARKGWRQADLARALGTSSTTMSARWMGLRQWQLEDLEIAAQQLGIPVERFFARSEGFEPPTFWLVVVRAVRAAYTRFTRRDRGRAARGTLPGPVASVYSITTGERVA